MKKGQRGTCETTYYFFPKGKTRYTLGVHTWWYNQKHSDFPGGLVVKNLPCNAEDVSLSAGQRTKIPYTLEQLSPCAATAEAHMLLSLQATTTESVYHYKDPAWCNEDPVCCN